MEKPHKLIHFSHTVYGLESQACDIPKRESNHLIKQEPLKHYVLRQINFLIKTPKVHVNMIIFKTKQTCLYIVFTSCLKNLKIILSLIFTANFTIAFKSMNLHCISQPTAS